MFTSGSLTDADRQTIQRLVDKYIVQCEEIQPALETHSRRVMIEAEKFNARTTKIYDLIIKATPLLTMDGASEFDSYREDAYAFAEALKTLSEDNRKLTLITVGVIAALSELI